MKFGEDRFVCNFVPDNWPKGSDVQGLMTVTL